MLNSKHMNIVELKFALQTIRVNLMMKQSANMFKAFASDWQRV